jgi:uncharacterized membrane protein
VTTLQTLALIAFAAVLVAILKQISWSEFVSNKKRQHLVFGSTASLFVLWIFRAGIYEGLDVHFLWLTAITLTLGFRYAVLTATVALIGMTAIGKSDIAMFGVSGLFGIAIPVAVSYLVFMVAFHKLPRHVFIYIFICAFFPGAAMIALKMGLLGGYFVADGLHSWEVVKDNYLVLIPLLLFPEGMLNGMTMTLLVIYKPDWIYTFHDKFYIDNK